MEKEKIVNKVKKYIDVNNIKYISDSLRYLKYENNGLVRDGTKRAMHLVSYFADYDSDILTIHTAFIDAKTSELMYIMTPQGYIEIEE